MANRNDFIKIFKGLGIVADSIITHNKSGLAEKVDRMKFHSSELLKVFVEISSEYAKGETSSPSNETHATKEEKPADKIGFSLVEESELASVTIPNSDEIHKSRQAKMRERAVPATPIARMMGFGGLAMRMVAGAATERAVNLVTGSATSSSISDQNAERLAETLCRMRGAALKLGQMLSLQDETALPPAVSKALDRVKQSADFMPKRQLHAQLESQLGVNWRDKFISFDEIPIAAASIGQVHKAVLHDGTVVAMKIQYPGVGSSIESDLLNLKRLISVANVLPRGLFIDQIIKVASSELALECDYELEAANQSKYRQLVSQDSILAPHSSVPEVYLNLTTKQILTSKFVDGLSIDTASSLPLSVRNAIARTALVSSIKELFEWRFVQSDPNFANFLYDHKQRIIHFIDFGATREYSKTFVDQYLRLVWAAASRNEPELLQLSKQMGFLTGDESLEMVAAHVQAGFVIGEPFRSSEPFDFGNSKITERLSSVGSVFMKHRLTPPPTETYSLHRKLAGAFYLCIRLKACIPCRDILEDMYYSYKFDDDDVPSK